MRYESAMILNRSKNQPTNQSTNVKNYTVHEVKGQKGDYIAMKSMWAGQTQNEIFCYVFLYLFDWIDIHMWTCVNVYLSCRYTEIYVNI